MDFIKKFDNGLTLIVKEMEGIYSASVAVAVNVGSSMEPPKCNGYSHFIEHMLFKGTKKRSALDISEAIEDVGGQLNAYTSKDVTMFYTKTGFDHVEKCMELLSDMFFDSVFDAEELEREKDVVIEEIIMNEDLPDDVCQDLLAEALYGDSALGRTILGPKMNIQLTTREELMAFKERYYTAPNVCISVAGNVKAQKVLVLVEKYFAERFGSEKKPESNPLQPIPMNKGLFLERRKDSEQSYICIGCPSAGVGEPENYPNSVLSNILGGGMSSRLFQNLREKQGLCYSVYSYLSAYKNNGYFELYVGTSPNKAQTAVRALRSELDRFFTQKPSERELLRGIEQYKGSMLLSLENSITVATLMANSILKTGKVFNVEERIQAIEAVTHADLMKSAERLLNPKEYSMAYVGKPLDCDLLRIFAE